MLIYNLKFWYFSQMTSIVLFGTGNLATHLFQNLSSSENFRVIQVYNHRPEGLQLFSDKTATTSKPEEIIPADIYLFALKDEAIPAVAAGFKDGGHLWVHTSGATPMAVLNKFKRTGVLYPLQTFSKNKSVDFSEVPVCIEANNEQDLQVLDKLGKELSGTTYRVSSEQRKALHVAAVFVSNFVNSLYCEGEEICAENKLPFDILKPLIKETAAKILHLSPTEAQTGPAKRNDLTVIQSHLDLLDKDQKKIYEVLTQSIQKRHGKKL